MSARELGGTTAATVRLSVRVTALCWVLVLLDGLDLFVYGATLPGVLADKSFGLTAVVASGLSSSGFVVFAIAGVLGAAMVSLVRRAGNPVSVGEERTTARSA